MSNKCCKVEFGIGCSSENCDDETLSGLRDLRIALRCYVLSTIETQYPDKMVESIVMNTLANNPSDGDDDSAFYSVCTKDKTLSHTFAWTCPEDSNNKQFSETITGQIPLRNSRTFTILQKWMCQDVIIIGKEAGPDGRWIMCGLGGGLTLNNVEGGTGAATNDNNNTTITISGEDLTRSWCYIFNTDQSTTDALIDSISSTAV